MPFELTPRQQALKDEFRAFSEEVVRPYSDRWGESVGFPWDLAKEFAARGYLSILIPKEHGGQGLGFLELCLLMEEVARVDPDLCEVPQFMANWGPFMIGRFGSIDLKKRYFPVLASGECLMAQGMTEPHAGSALTDLSTTATVKGDTVVVNGRKFFTTYGQFATDIIVFARFGESAGPYGIGAVIVPTDTHGFRVLRELPTMGRFSGATEAEIEFDNCVVPVSQVLLWGDPGQKDTFRSLMASYDAQRAGAAARALGLAQGAVDEAVRWAKTRRQFGRRICEFQGIQWMLANMTILVETARAICYTAAAGIDAGRERGGLSTAIAKAFCNDVALRVADDALQILGARGYMRGEFSVERRVRHARMLPIAGGTHQMLLNLIAGRVLGEKFTQRPP